MNSGNTNPSPKIKLRYRAVSTVSNYFLNKKGFKKTLFPKILSRSREKEPKKKLNRNEGLHPPLPRSKVKV